MPRRLSSEFSSLLTASFITSLGDGLRLAALPLLTTTLTTSPFLISSLTAAQYLPWITFAPIGGVIVDRSNKRRLIMVTQTWRAAVMGLLTLAVLADVAQIWHLFIVAFVITAGEILVDPSVVTMIPTIVDDDDLDRANGQINTVEVATNDFAGQTVGAFAFGFVPWLPFLLDALSYFTSIGPFSRVGVNRPTPPRTQPRPTRAELAEGFQWIRRHQFLRPLTAATAIFHIGTGGTLGLLVALIVNVLDESEFAYGLVLAAAALGAVIGSPMAADLADRWSRRAVITGAAIAAGVSLLLGALATAVWQVMILWIVNGAAFGLYHSIGRGFIQRNTPLDRLGRTAIAQRMIGRGAFVVGALLIGTIGEIISIRWALGIAAAFHLIGAARIWRAFDHDEAPAAG